MFSQEGLDLSGFAIAEAKLRSYNHLFDLGWTARSDNRASNSRISQGPAIWQRHQLGRCEDNRFRSEDLPVPDYGTGEAHETCPFGANRQQAYARCVLLVYSHLVNLMPWENRQSLLYHAHGSAAEFFFCMRMDERIRWL